ncbi:MAG TPA: SusD/RagB family nutrient-binding outer membrane lipoprotein [Prolixibacteraceae bacterium]|nr:SusD/RagB family nutrient-binding outer membrane lipoprotein [Prolixibacteraceae bacterium]HRV89189.1 SusD/RagB family nutrient-binding outer membrane lipoprotein [Prolixibacteraceae bacterium]
MKNRLFKICTVFTLTALLLVNCTDRFAEKNLNPNDINDPDLSHLFTNALYNTAGDEYLQWFYNNSVYFWRFAQMTVSRSGTSADFNNTGALGGIPLYKVMIDMKEIQNRIDNMNPEDKAVYQAFRAVTVIPVIELAIRASDWQGSMVYSEAIDARYGGNLTPKFDTQQELYDLWIQQLDEAINVLTTASSDQVKLGNQDFMFKGDWELWARYANSLKLRIAARLEVADNAKMKTVLTSIVNKKGSDGKPLLITEEAHQAIWAPGASEMGPGGTNSLWVENYAPSKNFSAFMRRNQDPRLRLYFRVNSLSDAAIAALQATPGVKIPKFAKTPVNEPWDRLVGGPVAPDSMGIEDFFGPTLVDATNTQYSRLPRVEYNFIKPKQDGRVGEYRNVVLGAPEVCLYLAEFIEKGYVSGAGTAKEWYEKGVTVSLKNMDKKASLAQIPDYSTRGLKAGETEALMAKDDVKYIAGDAKNKEKIILQQMVNLFDNPYEMVAVARRTGYPKKTSTIWAWEPYMAGNQELKLPRRFPWGTPSIESNKANWDAATAAQGFKADDNYGTVLNSQRVWWDKNAPDYGQGN